MVANIQPPSMTAQTYLDWEPRQELRYEYIDGEVLAMTGGTLPHSELAINLSSLLKTHLRGQGCRVLGADAKVGITENGPFFYADISVTCHPADRTALQYSRHPCLIVEVLSPSTEADDRGAKFAQYRRLDSLQEYVLISSDRVNIEIFRLNPNGKWELSPYGPGDEIMLTSVELQFTIGQLYENIPLTPPSV